MQALYSKIIARVSIRSSPRALVDHRHSVSARALPPNLLLSFNSANRTTRNTSRSMSSSSPIYTVDYLTSKLKKDLQAEHVDMEDLSNCGCGMKFDAVIVSPQFEGKPILQRQRLVNQILSDEMKHIHAFTMRTLTPSQWTEAQNKKGHGSN